MLAATPPTVKYGCPCIKSASVGNFGQGKTTATIVADQGDLVTIITDVPYDLRSRQSRKQAVGGTKGQRQMHRTTIQIPSQEHTDYTTTVQANYSGRKHLSAPVRRYPFLSAQVTQVAFRDTDRPTYSSQYMSDYFSKDIPLPADLKLPAFDNKMSMTEGVGMKRSLSAAADQSRAYPYWTQYARIHGRLGVMLGPGIATCLPVRRSYNPITGKETSAAMQENNRKVSGNRVLYNGYRKDAEKHFILG